MMRGKSATEVSRRGSWPPLYSGLVGGLFALGFLKFGNAIVVDKYIAPPQHLWEVVFQPWPLTWGYPLWILTGCLGLTLLRWPAIRWQWPVWLLAVWFAWQLLAGTQSSDLRLTQVTLGHFAMCVGCFALGLLVLSQLGGSAVFWVVVLAGFLSVVWVGFEQHFGGLEATRKFFYEQPDWRMYPAEYIKRISSNRIFATLASPNALAGLVVLVLPSLAVSLWSATGWLTRPTRLLLVAVPSGCGLMALYWTGSKGGWLVCLVVGMLALAQAGVPRRTKLLVLCCLLLAGSLGFALRFKAYFSRGATSVVARFDYWEAAVTVCARNPVWGSGPGTFGRAYARIKPPEAEMTRLVHNDYLEQGSDSGLVGCLSYSGFVVGSLWKLRRRVQRDTVARATWLGLAGWALHGLVDYGLYIPALAWPAFTLFGWLWGSYGAGPEIASTKGDLVSRTQAARGTRRGAE